MTPSRALEIAQALVRFPSVTPTDGGALPYLAEVLDKAGFETHLLPFSEPGQAEVLNLYARFGKAGRCLAFAGHTDVVPPGDLAAWTHDPYAGTVEDGMLHGRGACDMKGGVAASVAAALAFAQANPQPSGSIAILLTGDEEGPAVNGTVKLLDWAAARGERFEACILGEPTNPNQLGDMVKIGRRGSLTGEVRVRGTQGHVAYPHLARNPIPPMMAVLDALLTPPLDAGNAHFDPSNLEVVTIDTGNPATNVIPAETRARFNIRFNDHWTAETLRAEITRRADAVHTGCAVDLTFQPCNAEAFLTAPGALSTMVQDAIEAETGRRPVLSTTGGTSDARFIVHHCPVVEFGLVGQTMHQVDERIAVADLEALTAIYGRIIEAFFA